MTKHYEPKYEVDIKTFEAGKFATGTIDGSVFRSVLRNRGGYKYYWEHAIIERRPDENSIKVSLGIALNNREKELALEKANQS